MNNRKIASLEVSPICFGANVFGWTIDEAQSFKILDALVDSGLNFIDTADKYSTWVAGNSGGESEKIIGNWFKKSQKRDKIILATKVGGDMGNGKKGLSEKYIFEAVEASLKRLQTDYIDLYQSHYDDPETPFEETMNAFSKLIQQGKVREIGASNISKDRLKESLQVSENMGLPKYVCLQPEYNLYDREKFEKEYEQLVLEEDISVISYYSLASGFLSGKYRSEADFNKSQRGGKMSKYLNERGFRILNALDEMANRFNSSPTSVALAWLLHKPAVTAPIVSATTISQLEDLVESASLKLSAEDVAFLDKESKF